MNLFYETHTVCYISRNSLITMTMKFDKSKKDTSLTVHLSLGALIVSMSSCILFYQFMQ